MSETRWDCTCGSFGIGDAEYTRHAISTKGPHTKYPAAPAAAEPLGTCFGGHADGHVEMASCERWKPLAEPVPQSEPPLPRCIYCANPGMYTLSHLGKHFDIRGQEHACLLAAPSPAETSQASAEGKLSCGHFPNAKGECDCAEEESCEFKIAKARLEEALWWEHLCGLLPAGAGDHAKPDKDCMYCRRIAKLQAALAGPGDAKETCK